MRQLALPSVRYSQVFHIGSLDPTKKRGLSYEGHGLSVSLNPEAWRRIANLAGPCWILTRRRGIFLDVNALRAPQWARLEEWGLSQGFLVRTERFELSWYDSELDMRLASLFPTDRQAREEGEDFGDAKIRAVLISTATPKLSERAGFEVPDNLARDLAALCYVELETDLDGLWWDDNETAITAPRGAIVPSRLPLWSRERT